jgi:hypothetical protein
VKSLWIASSVVAGTLALTGCLGTGAEDQDAVGAAGQADETTNSLTANSLTANSLTANSLTANSLTANSLTANSLTSNSLTADALTDPAARSVLTYIVGCALPAGQSFVINVEGTNYAYAGQLGIAPAWGTPKGKCDDNCALAVSSCVLARLNYLGEVVPISVRGGNLKTTPTELADYPDVDGTYYGNVFASPQIRYACLPPGVTELTRVCGPTLTGCVVTSQGPCVEVCNNVRNDGSFPNCTAWGDRTTYNSAITVFLQ